MFCFYYLSFCVLRIHQCNKHVDNISWEEVKRRVQPPFIIIIQWRMAITKRELTLIFILMKIS